MTEANPDTLTLEERVARLEARVFSPCCQAVEDAKNQFSRMLSELAKESKARANLK